MTSLGKKKKPRSGVSEEDSELEVEDREDESRGMGEESLEDLREKEAYEVDESYGDGDE